MIKRKFRIFWAWQDDKEEHWLREMAVNGWRLKDFNFLIYTFEKIEPKDIIYKLDYKATCNRDIEEYLDIYESVGWKHVTQFLGWHYFYTEAKESQLPDIYSDVDSKIQKYKGLFRLLFIITLVNIPNFINLVFNPIYHHDISSINILRFLLGFMLLFLGYGTLKIYLKIRKLKHRL